MKQKKLVSTEPILRDFAGNLDKRWYWEWYDVKGLRKKAYIPNFPLAAERMDDAAAKIEKIKTGLVAKPIPYQSVIYQQLKPLLDKHCEPLRQSSEKDYNAVLNNFEVWLLANNYKSKHVKSFGRVDAENFCRFLEVEKKLNNATYNKYVNVLDFLFEYLVRDGIVAKSPFTYVKPKKRHSISVTAFKDDAVAKLKPLLKEKNTTVYVACMLDMYAFIRPNEIRNLRLKDIDFQSNNITVDKSFSKNKKTQQVAMVGTLRQILVDYIGPCKEGDYFLLSKSGKPGILQISSKYVVKAHNKILSEAGYDITKFKPYSWKHTGNSLAYRNGASLRFLKLQNRHHSETMTEIYIKSIVPEDLVQGQEQYFNF
jgi:integrase